MTSTPSRVRSVAVPRGDGFRAGGRRWAIVANVPPGVHERGIALVIALVAMAAMAVSAMSLVRAVDVTMTVTGNMAFHQSAASAPDGAIEEAIAALFERRLIANPDADETAQSYFASRMPGEDGRGVPNALATLANYPPEARVIHAGNGNSIRYVIERMCLGPGEPTVLNCTLIPSSDSVMTISGGASIEPPRVPLFRQTIRVDGPAGAALFVQAWLADLPGRRRVSWRALAE